MQMWYVPKFHELAHVFYCYYQLIHKKKIIGKCSKILNTFLFLFSNKMLVIRTGTHKKFVRIANREDPDQTASEEAVCFWCALFV